jgi:hypothetical protein
LLTYLEEHIEALAPFRVQLSEALRSVFHLQRVLGHSTSEITRRYANPMTEDLQAVWRVSLLSLR